MKNSKSDRLLDHAVVAKPRTKRFSDVLLVDLTKNHLEAIHTLVNRLKAFFPNGHCPLLLLLSVSNEDVPESVDTVCFKLVAILLVLFMLAPSIEAFSL